MLMRPGEAHFIEVDPSVPYERICIVFNINLFAHLDPENNLLAPYFERAAGIYNHYPATFYRAYKAYFGHSPKHATPTNDSNDIA